jgi:hypothetical protein
MAFIMRGIYNSPVSDFIEFIDVQQSLAIARSLMAFRFAWKRIPTFAIPVPCGTGK